MIEVSILRHALSNHFRFTELLRAITFAPVSGHRAASVGSSHYSGSENRAIAVSTRAR